MNSQIATAKGARRPERLAWFANRHPVLRRHLCYGALATLISLLLIASCFVGVLLWHVF